MIDYYQIVQDSGASQDSFEMSKLMEVVSVIEPDVIVEIGVDTGRNLAAWWEAFKPLVLLGINEAAGMDRFDQEKFRKKIIVGDSHDPDTKLELEKRLGDDLIDFLFIDGDHTFEGVQKDFEMYGSLVRPGGIIAFHDIMRDPNRVPHHAGVDCRRFFNRIKNNYASMEIWNGVRGDDGPGIGVIFL